MCSSAVAPQVSLIADKMSNHVEVKNIEPTTFEDRYYDEYEYYNLTDRYTGNFLKRFITRQLYKMFFEK